MTRTTVLAFPFAGGSATSYRPLQAALPPELAFVPCEPPGRGRRYGEALCTTMPALVDDALAQARPHLQRGPVALFGHSMGAHLAWLLALRLRDEHLPAPRCLLLTGAAAPAARRRETPWHALPREAFLRVLGELGGLPEAILADPEAVALFEPILRADLTAMETYRVPDRPPLTVPIRVLTGASETFDLPDVLAWEDVTTGPFQHETLPGSHFFLFETTASVARWMADALAETAE
ncbi:MAG: thioesterase II family protein [Planctomycetota bacterium]